MTSEQRAREGVRKIRENVDRWYADEISLEAFRANQGRLWRWIEESPKAQWIALALLRGDDAEIEEIRAGKRPWLAFTPRRVA